MIGSLIMFANWDLHSLQMISVKYVTSMCIFEILHISQERHVYLYARVS